MPEESTANPLRTIAKLLNRHQVKFLVIGGQAEYLFGSARVTLDVDLCYRRNHDNFDRLAKALVELEATLRGAPRDVPFLLDAETLAKGNNFTFETNLGIDLDLLGHVEPLGDYDDILVNAETYEIADVVVQAISLDDLIHIKGHLQRPK